jgi:hypothetical protein
MALQGETGNVSPQLSPHDMRGWTTWDIKEKRITNEKTRRTAGNSPNGIDDGNAKMSMALQTQRNGRVRISKVNAWRMLSNTTTDRETAADRTVRHAYIPPKKLGFEEEKGKLRDWMTVARDGPIQGTNVESCFGVPPGSFTDLRRQ